MDEPWRVTQGTDNDGPFVVKLNGRFKDSNARVGLPTRVSFTLVGEALVRWFVKDEATRAPLEDTYYEYARRRGGALVATIYRPASYTYLIHLPSGSLDTEGIPVPDALLPHFKTETCGDVDWDEYCGYLLAKVQPKGLLGALRHALDRLRR